MAEPQLSLSWDAYQKSICNGLSLLQQREEFVDMTLAADGHHVKVHKMVLSLVSPYVKELISSAQCPHPIIFLNNISYSTLCAVLEYIYTGEVLLPKDKLPDLIAAGKALHIKGLKGMDEPEPSPTVPPDVISSPKSISERLTELKEKKLKAKPNVNPAPVLPMCKIFVNETGSTNDENMNLDVHDETISADEDDSKIESDAEQKLTSEPRKTKTDDSNCKDLKENTGECFKDILLNRKLQYTVSNQGGLQVIHNRFIYHLRYCGKKKHVRLWRCVDYSVTHLKCPANVYTDENNRVTSRSHNHNHPFHDDKILKKIRKSKIYLAFTEAANVAESRRKERRIPCSTADELSN